MHDRPISIYESSSDSLSQGSYGFAFFLEQSNGNLSMHGKAPKLSISVGFQLNPPLPNYLLGKTTLDFAWLTENEKRSESHSSGLLWKWTKVLGPPLQEMKDEGKLIRDPNSSCFWGYEECRYPISTQPNTPWGCILASWRVNWRMSVISLKKNNGEVDLTRRISVPKDTRWKTRPHLMEMFEITMEKKDRNARHLSPEMTKTKLLMIVNRLAEQTLTPVEIFLVHSNQGICRENHYKQ